MLDAQDGFGEQTAWVRALLKMADQTLACLRCQKLQWPGPFANVVDPGKTRCQYQLGVILIIGSVHVR
ncbi:hypothetical protein [Microvirga rosea]|uniref:hypothetical protein n=1 Tax=Microvirga rosea TaxID=2715425 RepID=UPI001D0BDE80|nr:hypothetical protein [Microvirga rosea]MCB8819308.1 hypothetical protein [Microvirga rosea]